MATPRRSLRPSSSPLVVPASSSRPAVLAELAGKIAPGALAGERLLPVVSDLAGVFPERGLVRGRTWSCSGQAATSLAISLAAAAVAEGSWVVFVGLPDIGPDAVTEMGVPLERVAAVALDDVDRAAAQWVDVVAAAADGFDLIITRVPDGVSPAAARTLAARLRQRGAVLVVIGAAGAVAHDGELRTDIVEWGGLGVGHGYLRSRSVEVRAEGRRLRRCKLRTSLLGAQAGEATVLQDPQTGHDSTAHDSTDRDGTDHDSTDHDSTDRDSTDRDSTDRDGVNDAGASPVVALPLDGAGTDLPIARAG